MPTNGLNAQFYISQNRYLAKLDTEQATKAHAAGDGATAIHGARLHLLPGLAGGGERPHGARIFRRALWGCNPRPPEGDPRGSIRGRGCTIYSPANFP